MWKSDGSHKSGINVSKAITLRGAPAVVVLSKQDYDRLTQREVSLTEFMRNSPLSGADDVQFTRDQSLTREIDL
ncbi:type II toxin-antitoxin system Phd/YefM family antitoxin [Acidithiobacillus sp. VAN18-1]|uniref:Type II toxin-antitoxin system Phd/YefM family antitoxin n=1 Tax=Igneacidithiobacillus copahuensis TaxID=2724909 RepID=A0AAE3CKE8_9PROT|nr:type II toxin-antitoxin system Phd/YefM family antitoxin [Igneacidithiobacillus copahuensis]MBU2796926.1 type II toxin-antitoxin system Phd/YefM family antitoxin [Acidithiobacillus sp. VAN18-2]